MKLSQQYSSTILPEGDLERGWVLLGAIRVGVIFANSLQQQVFGPHPSNSRRFWRGESALVPDFAWWAVVTHSEIVRLFGLGKLQGS